MTSEKKKLKVLLMRPIYDVNRIYGGFRKAEATRINTALLGLAAIVRQNGYEVDIIDPETKNISCEEFKEQLKRENYDIIGISAVTAVIVDAYSNARIIKECSPRSLIILGGVHITLIPEKTMEECPELDIGVIGEGDYTILDICKFKQDLLNLNDIPGIIYREKGRLVKTPPRPPIENLDDLPFPAYDMIDMSKLLPEPHLFNVKPTMDLMASRGCPFRCAFCCAPLIMGKHVRFKSPEYIIREIEHLQKDFGVKGITFQDSTFTFSGKWIKEFRGLIVKKKVNIKYTINTRVDRVNREILQDLKDSGCWKIRYGFESGNQKSLDLMRKGTTVRQNEEAAKLTRAMGMEMHGTFIIGLPEEDEADIINTINFAKRAGMQTAAFYLPRPFPGTYLYDKYGKEEVNGCWERLYINNFDTPILLNKKIDRDKLVKMAKRSYLQFYLSPRTLVNNLLSIRTVHDIKRYYHGFKIILSFKG